eukprot:IDg5119t1
MEEASILISKTRTEFISSSSSFVTSPSSTSSIKKLSGAASVRALHTCCGFLVKKSPHHVRETVPPQQRLIVCYRAQSAANPFTSSGQKGPPGDP